MPENEQNKYTQREDQRDLQPEDPKTGDVAPQQTVTSALPSQDAATPVSEPGQIDRSEFVECKTVVIFSFLSKGAHSHFNFL